MTARDPQRVLMGRIGAYAVHSRYDSRELTRPAREAFWSKFEPEVDPDGTLDPAERSRRADMARKAYFARLALKSAQVRARRSRRERRRSTAESGASDA